VTPAASSKLAGRILTVELFLNALMPVAQDA